MTTGIKIKTEWELKKYYYESLQDPKLQEDIDTMMLKVDAFVSTYQGKIKTISSAEEMFEYYEENERLSGCMQKPGLYLFYLSSLDTQNTEVIKKYGELEVLSIEINTKLLFVSQEFKELGYDKLMTFANDPILKDHKNDLIRTANNLKYILSEKEEYVLNQKGRALSAPENLYEELTNSYEFEVEIDGEKKMITDSEARTLLGSPDRELRKRVMEARRKVYLNKQTQITLGNIYSQIVKDWVSDIKIRGNKTVMEPRNISEEMENEVVDLLMQEVQSAYPLFARYINAKKKLLGYETFHSWDIFAPLVSTEKHITFEEAVRMHLEAMKEFDDEFYQHSLDLLENGRVDVMPRLGKRGGAFASYTKNQPSFVLLNYTEKLRDVPTLSHEIGHAIHGNLSQAQKSSVFNSGLCLAETASIFSEMLLSEKLKKELTKEEKIDFLNGELEDLFSVIFRQIQYVSFEKRVHEEIASGKELTYIEFNRMWREEQLKMSGESIVYDVPEDQEGAWSSISHIFSVPFYCYAYSFGNLVVMALYKKYKNDGKKFIEDYKNILRAGGSMPPKELLAQYGIDITKPEFYRDGIAIVEEKVKEFEALVG